MLHCFIESIFADVKRFIASSLPEFAALVLTLSRKDVKVMKR
jgi:hypothetical protein